MITNKKFRVGVSLVLVSFFATSVFIFFWPIIMEVAGAATDDSVIDVNLDISATISNSCDASVTMGAITGTGQSALTTNEADCTVITNNSSGYSLTFTSATTYLENADGDQIAAYTPAAAGTPEQWSVAATDSEWGVHLKSTSTTYASGTWGAAAGTEDYAAADVLWHNVTNGSGFTVANRATETAGAGDTETLMFGAEVGSSKVQPTGTYDVDVTVTATTN